ncbi:hypothetical protein GCM10022246_13320 [Pedobacter ginsengiterrae]|uniref:Uncharacterized protein n=1 Tax=Pedobacter ginsengiterrae TaxID=871696 RepID=A0ABP7P8K3_9SPHI
MTTPATAFPLLVTTPLTNPSTENKDDGNDFKLMNNAEVNKLDFCINDLLFI